MQEKPKGNQTRNLRAVENRAEFRAEAVPTQSRNPEADLYRGGVRFPLPD